MTTREAVIVSTARTPIGRAYRGAFNALPSPTLASHAIRAAVERAGVDPAEVEDVIIELDNVEDVAVYSEENALLGHIVVARVTTTEPEPVASLKKRIRQACGARLAPFKVPSKVVLADQDLYSARLKKMRRGA